MSNELAIKDNRVTPQVWNMIKEMAPVMHQARLFGMASQEQAEAIMLKGFELGLGITASFELVQVVMGKPALSPRGALALLHNSPEIKEIRITELSKDGKFLGFECFMKRSNGFEYTAKWTMEDAKNAGLIKPDSGWANYPKNMCLWRCVGFAADVVAPDLIAGMSGLMKMPERYGVALSESGDIIDMKVSDVPQNPAPATVADQPTPQEEMHVTLEQAVEMFGPDAVMNANGGTIPATQEEIDAAVMRLAEAVK